MIYKENAEILERSLNGNYLTLRLDAPKIAAGALPGQFVNIRVSDGFDPLLRRPFGIYDIDGNTLSVMALLRGKGTRALAGKQPGGTLSVLGPLGNPFPAPHPGKPPVLIAGGVGAAPFLYFARGLSKPKMILGARDRSLLPPLQYFREVCDLIVATDDGSEGVRGTVIDALRKFDLSAHTFYACGPKGMFAALTDVFSAQAIPPLAYYSLETYMGCGFGACKGCSVPAPDGSLKLCCKDGPTFRWDEVML